jgi:hypothetical protein
MDAIGTLGGHNIEKVTSDHHKWQERTGRRRGSNQRGLSTCREQAGLASAAHEPHEVLQEMKKTTIERQRRGRRLHRSSDDRAPSMCPRDGRGSDSFVHRKIKNTEPFICRHVDLKDAYKIVATCFKF